jgi:hypothetical protein
MMNRRGKWQRRSSRSGAGDHDEPYSFGAPPSAERPYPFHLFQYARLLMLRGELREGAFEGDREGRYYFTQHDGIVWIERDGSTYLRRPMEAS